MKCKSDQSNPSLVSRRSALRLLAAAGVVTLAAACGPTVPSAAPTSAPAAAPKPAATTPPAAAPAGATAAAPAATVAVSATSQAGAPKTGGTLRVAIMADPASLDGHLYAAGRFDTTWLIYDRLSEYDLNLKPQPMLAESWDVSSDYKSIKLNLRKGVTFHDGREFTSDDVKYNLQRGRDPKAGSGTYVNQAKWFDSFETPDKYTLVMRSDVSRPAMFDYFNALNMIDPVTTEGPSAKQQAVGTGPFTFVEWIQGDHVTLARNKNYWRSDRPYLDSIVISVVRDVVAIRYIRTRVDRLMEERPDVRDSVVALIRKDLRAAHEHLIALGCPSAKQRVANFLLQLAHRAGAKDGDTIEIELGRQDMADYLGLTLETISRTLSEFKRIGAIALPKRRQIIICSKVKLRAQSMTLN